MLVRRPAPPGIRPFLEINGQYRSDWSSLLPVVSLTPYSPLIRFNFLKWARGRCMRFISYIILCHRYRQHMHKYFQLTRYSTAKLLSIFCLILRRGSHALTSALGAHSSKYVLLFLCRFLQAREHASSAPCANFTACSSTAALLPSQLLLSPPLASSSSTSRQPSTAASCWARAASREAST